MQIVAFKSSLKICLFSMIFSRSSLSLSLSLSPCVCVCVQKGYLSVFVWFELFVVVILVVVVFHL